MVAFFPAMLYSRPPFIDHVAFAGIETVTKLKDWLVVVLADDGNVTTSFPSTLVNVG